MTQYDIWSVVFIAWQSKQNEVLQALQKGQINAKSQKGMHVRKDAEFILLLETGQVLAHGRIDQIRGTIIVASAFKALGCHVKVLGVEAAGRAEPDCIVEYKSPSGQILELLVDAKAGRWNGAIDDIRSNSNFEV